MKIQALAVAAASLALAVPALPAQADGQQQLRRALTQVANIHCNVLARGGTWRQAVFATMDNTEYSNVWYPAAKRGEPGLYDKLVALKVQRVNEMCRSLNSSAFRRHQMANGNLPSAPRYTGGNTTISEDPFEF
mgnify:CR=1 FL=1